MHLIENKGVKSECKKFGENSRQMPSVSTICDEYCIVLSYNYTIIIICVTFANFFFFPFFDIVSYISTESGIVRLVFLFSTSPSLLLSSCM